MQLTKPSKRIGCLALAAIASFLPVTGWGFEWMDSRTHPRVILYADETIEEAIAAHPSWFDKDFVIAGLGFTFREYGQYDEAKVRSMRFRNTLTGHYSSGRLISGTTVMRDSDIRQYPSPAVAIEDMPFKTRYLGTWMRNPKQAVLDLSDTATRDGFVQAVRVQWSQFRTSVQFVDDAAVHPRVAQLQPWAAYCDTIKALRDMANELNSRIIFGVFVRPWEMTEPESKQLIDAIGSGNGIALPLPWSKSIENDKTANAWAIYRYRQMLNAGMAVIMIPSDDAPLKDIMTWVASWRAPQDKIYFAAPVWNAPPW